MQSKVRELEEKCRTQSEQFSLLSQDLERLRQHAGKIDLLGVSPGVSVDVPAPGKPFPQFMNGLSPSIGKGECSAEEGWPVTPHLGMRSERLSDPPA